jgi:hypothetical protein
MIGPHTVWHEMVRNRGRITKWFLALGEENMSFLGLLVGFGGRSEIQSSLQCMVCHPSSSIDLADLHINKFFVSLSYIVLHAKCRAYACQSVNNLGFLQSIPVFRPIARILVMWGAKHHTFWNFYAKNLHQKHVPLLAMVMVFMFDHVVMASSEAISAKNHFCLAL